MDGIGNNVANKTGLLNDLDHCTNCTESGNLGTVVQLRIRATVPRSDSILLSVGERYPFSNGMWANEATGSFTVDVEETSGRLPVTREPPDRNKTGAT